MKTKFKIAVVIMIGLSFKIKAQDLVSGGSNSWIFHTPDDSRTTLYLAPKKENLWDWSRCTMFLNDGSVILNGALKYNGVHGVKLMIEKSSWANHKIIETGWNNFNGDWTEISVPGKSQNSANIILNKFGNVGIGTSNPFTNLQIHSNNTDTRIALTNNHSGNTTSDGFVLINESDSEVHLLNRENAALKFSTYETERMRITANGNVGIGISDTQGFKLGVKGKIAAEEVKVATYTNWPDYVFENNYLLPTLSEVENHIQKNGHLKDIPSAKEIEKEGFFLGNMDAKLLQKIEELTLYTIAQEKQLKAQEEKIKNLENQTKEKEDLAKLNSKIEIQQKEIENLKILVTKLMNNNKK